MKSAARISLVVLLLMGLAAPASAAPATAPVRHDDPASTFGKPYYDSCVFPSPVWCDQPKNRQYS